MVLGEVTPVNAFVKSAKVDATVSSDNKQIVRSNEIKASSKQSIREYLVGKIKNEVLPNLDTPDLA